MPLTPYQDDYRNQIADALMPSRADSSPLARITSAIPTNLTPQLNTAMPAGMPATPAGGVPGSGLAPAGPSTVQLPTLGRQGVGLYGEMPGMASKALMRRPQGVY